MCEISANNRESAKAAILLKKSQFVGVEHENGLTIMSFGLKVMILDATSAKSSHLVFESEP